ncbi:GNAT family N-acetyltransferase [Vibrio genomosp. F10]|uniref:GNAT family N-acetyltransferase n=1 Tax=Vibrio genomosp. F10 TaxID=723171 RepID=UPI00084C631A|nr:GNAT family N-acetyltransferase [Vibrio genomosp. F10]OEE98306.1 GNAT family N-acetyltransferase [Vibrio genomosp. F10 str. 9ZD137]
MTIVTRRLMLLPYSDSLQSEFLMLNCCVKNRAEMNGPHTVASARALFDRVLNDSSMYCMAVLDNYNREYIGHIFISQLESEPELGFIIDKAYWGKGLASEALKAFIPKAYRELSLQKVVATANTHHIASIKLLEKLGFQKVGENQDFHGPYYEYELTADVVANENSMA